MKSRVVLLAFFLILMVSSVSLSQIKSRLLPTNINKPSINYYAPYISGDGRTMLYLHDYTDEGHHAMMTATKKTVSTWNDGVEVNKLINRPTLNFRGGYSLSFDGDMLYYSSRRSGLGGFDIWSSKRRGNDWEAPKNLGSPTNTSENEAAPCVSPDGEYLYFMRCAKMSEYGGASGCRIVVSKKTNRGWGEAIDLPSNINTGNSQTPRLLADGVSMIFASDKFGGKGGLDLYMTKKEGEGWSKPVPLDFLNTDKNDQFVSTDAKGRYMYVSENTGRNNQLVMKLIPEELQPAKVMRIKGKVIDSQTSAPAMANLTIFNIDERDRLWNERLGGSGEFAIVLNEGASYDLAVESESPGYMYYSKVFDLQSVGTRDKQTLNINLEPIQINKSYTTEISFEDFQAKLKDNSTFELRRISNMMRKNPEMQLEITAFLNLYKSDSLKSDPDLTELVVDSVYVEWQIEIPVDEVLDSMYSPVDSLTESGSPMDSLSQISESISDSVRYETIRELKLEYTYHNDRSTYEAEAVKLYLVNRGIAEDRIRVKNSVDKTRTWIRENESLEPDDQEPIRRIEIKILNL